MGALLLRRHAPRSRCARRASAVVDVQDVAVGILEPGGLEISHHMDIAVATEAGQIIMLEADAGLAEASEDGVELAAEAPGGSGRTIGAGELRLVDQEGGGAASIGGHARTIGLKRRQAERPAIE